MDDFVDDAERVLVMTLNAMQTIPAPEKVRKEKVAKAVKKVIEAVTETVAQETVVEPVVEEVTEFHTIGEMVAE